MKPTLVYQKNGPHRASEGATYTYKGVRDEDSLKECLNPPKVEVKEIEIEAPEVKKSGLTEKEVITASDMLKQKVDPKEIAEHFKCHVNTIYKIRRNLAKDAV